MKAVSLMLLVSTLLLFIGCKTDDIDNRREECPGNVDMPLTTSTVKEVLYWALVLKEILLMKVLCWKI